MPGHKITPVQPPVTALGEGSHTSILNGNYPCAGSRMLHGLLRGEGLETGRLHVATLMKKMGIEAIYRRPNTSKTALGFKIYPYLLRKLTVTRPN